MRAEGKDYIVKDGDVMNSCLTFDFLTGSKHIFQEFCLHTGFKRYDFSSRKL
ncbi:hypothetical protein LL024_12985 [Enterobacter ludwigii]|nr:hypothetical protein [Enterobacter sp. BIDMC 30]EUM10068.1 hypothetical protein L466_02180 [Enterobacter sp. BIDMC 30]UEG31432.1 hypothetical protein LL022_12990 [Enterobacter ludwigii]UEG35532.1 hypothetical protein LL023_11235 [Enterobacter ludwigii]UEG40119.1 hypothetical protein LL024_12985 [Enterobacter ludwigii]